jgi:hypothetical protein
LLVLGGIAALAPAERAVPRAVAIVGVVFAVLLVIVPLPRTIDPEASFFAPAMTAARWLADRLVTGGGVAERLVLAVVALGAVVVAWRAAAAKDGRWRLVAVAGGAAIQIALLAVTYTAVLGGISGVPGRTGSDQAQLGFVDRATGGAVATWIDSQSRGNAPQEVAAARDTLLYNDGLRDRLLVPGNALPDDVFPLSLLRIAGSVNERTGVVRTFHPRSRWFFVAERSSPYIQLAGTTIARSREFPLDVVRVDGEPRASWLSRGLGLAGGIPADKPVTFTAWGPVEARVHLFAPTPVHVQWRAGDERRSLTVDPQQQTLSLRACGSQQQATVRTDGSAQVLGVDVTPTRC